MIGYAGLPAEMLRSLGLGAVVLAAATAVWIIVILIGRRGGRR